MKLLIKKRVTGKFSEKEQKGQFGLGYGHKI